MEIKKEEIKQKRCQPNAADVVVICVELIVTVVCGAITGFSFFDFFVR